MTLTTGILWQSSGEPHWTLDLGVIIGGVDRYTTDIDTIPEDVTLYMELESQNTDLSIEWLKNENFDSAAYSDGTWINQTNTYENGDEISIYIQFGDVNEGSITLKLNNASGIVVATIPFLIT